MIGLYIKTGMGLYLMISIFVMSSCSAPAEKKTYKLYTVEISQMQFQPATLNIQKGDTVVFINKDMLVHNVTDETTRTWSSSPLSTDSSYSLVCTASSDYYCMFHPTMKGKITVK